MLKFAFFVILIVTALLVIAIKFLPWWGSLLLIVILLFGLRFGAGYLFKQLMAMPFKAKGKVLAGATANVHGIRKVRPPIRTLDPAAANDPEEAQYLEDEQKDDQRFHWYLMEITIIPNENNGQFTFWEPGELLFVDMAAKPHDLESTVESKMDDYRIFMDGTFQKDDIGKHQGAQRIKFHVGLPPSLTRFQLRYYFELFGQIALPTS